MIQPDDFRGLGVSEATLGALAQMGYERPTEVQKETIPLCREGLDLVVQSRTGTGKTTAFGIPIVEDVDVGRGEVQAVILTPTRELTLQVRAETAELGSGRGVKVVAIYGGDSIDAQVRGIQEGAQVIVGTPGRVLDLLRRGALRFEHVRYLVLDEADRMLDMGFAQEMNQIMEFVPEERQTLLFSATIPLGIRALIYHYLNEPRWVLLSEDFAYVKDVRHTYIITPRMQKEAVLEKLIEYDQPTSSMIFCNTKEEVRSVASFLARRGLPVAMISSDLVQKKRELVMARFRNGEIRHLVATDVAARGIDIEELSHVFIYSTPESPEAYIHRAGRTGRIGRGGVVVSLVSATDLVSFNRLSNRYHLALIERSVPTEEEVEARKTERLVALLVDEAKEVPEDDIADLRRVVDAICEHPERARLIAYLMQRDFRAPVTVDEPPNGEKPAAETSPPREPHPGKRPRRRRSRRRKQ
ncbi:MAG TPA: DEAD/DEAH box helicase [Vicinamibacteria bacterium]|nr:DEAD/DEAH box helicase [Vicinamibacteria bacterium]